ncbi:MAG TPA: PadR family transcriptional regulator [Clostridiales bacterium]|nr:PadR family transcriptional regulator [Clostridiales bacterium]
MDSVGEILGSLAVELKRGTLVLTVLSQLITKEYGYSLVQKLEEKKVPIEAGTLYPLLRRLEKQGLLQSEWDTGESRPRKFYVLSEKGKDVYIQLKDEWRTISKQMEILLREEEKNEPD